MAATVEDALRRSSVGTAVERRGQISDGYCERDGTASPVQVTIPIEGRTASSPADKRSNSNELHSVGTKNRNSTQSANSSSPNPVSGVTPAVAEGRRVASNNNRSQPRSSKMCCLCWCCCCSLSTKNHEEDQGKSQDKSKTSYSTEPEVLPSLEEIRSWGESFDRLMRCSTGRIIFRDFLKCEYSEENILFWLACEDLKKETNPEGIEEKARVIYEDYISILSPREVSLDSRVRELVNKNMATPTPNTFDEAQLQIYTLMHRDSYPRFVNSSYYKKIAQLNGSSRKESSA